jgi:hypothetical protein
VSLSRIGNCSGCGFKQVRKLAHQRDFRTTKNVMFSIFYDIIAKVIAAQRFPALALLVDARKCHEMCGCVTFYDILGGLFLSWSGRCPIIRSPRRRG